MTEIRAIETGYAGYRFRSRLEARWAVFFDTLGITWQYEAQGYQFQSRIWHGPDFWYLPDFWLPGVSVHAEVKGFLDEPGARRVADAAACLGNLLVLGEIPKLEHIAGRWLTMKAPTWLEFRKGDLLASTWPDFDLADGYSPSQAIVANDSPEWVHAVNGSAARFIKWLVKGSTGFVTNEVEHAFSAARSARFEHGQSGAPGRWSR